MFSSLTGAVHGSNVKIMLFFLRRQTAFEITDFTVSNYSNCDFLFLIFFFLL